MDQTGASWNQLTDWLRRMHALQKTGRVMVIGRRAVDEEEEGRKPSSFIAWSLPSTHHQASRRLQASESRPRTRRPQCCE